MATTTKNIWYKRARIEGQQSTLQELLTNAVGSKALAGQRLMVINSNEQIGINLYQSSPTIFFGQFIAFTPGMTQPLVTIAKGSNFFDVEAIAAQNASDGTRREFLESIAYFGIVENHVLLVQTKVLNSRDLEEYLSWFLVTQTQAIPAGTVLTLDDPVASRAAKRAARDNIRGVTIGTPVRADPVAETTTGADVVRSSAVTRYELNEGVSQAIKGLFGESIFSSLRLEDSLEDDNIEVQLTVRVKGRRVVSDEGQKLLKAIGRATRHMDPRDYELELARSGSLKGTELKLHHPITINVNDTGLIEETSLMARMTAWLAEIAAKNLIELD